MRGDPFYEFPDYGYSSSSDHPEIAIFIFMILLVLYINRIINLKVDDYFINLIFTVLASIVLFSSFFVDNSPRFFSFLRITLTFSSMVLLILTIYYNSIPFVWIIRLLILLILIFYNSVFPIYFHSKDLWKIIDVISILTIISNNIYSYNLDTPFSNIRRKRIYTVKKPFNWDLEFLFPKGSDQYAGTSLIVFIYLFLIIALLVMIF